MNRDSDFDSERELFSRCLDRPREEWDQVLASHCEDPDLRARVRRLLERHQDTPTHDSGFLRLHGGDPDHIGPYRILRRLDEGGMGIVYAAEQQEPVRRRVAIKVMRGYGSREVLARFDVERQALALMNHANIARILDAGTTGDHRPYIVMEFVQGEPITTWCERQALSLHARLDLLCAVCDAVQHAHQKGVIHRDLKPSNILVMEEDGRPIPKIIDFGIAKAVSQRLTEQTLETKAGSLLGTPDYMSPEQAELSPLDVDTRSDVYALGAVMYRLLTGVPPLQLSGSGSSFAEIQRRILDELPLPPSRLVEGALRRQLRGELDWIVNKALEKRREDRYPSAAELAADIRRYLDNETVSAGPPSRTRRARRFLRRHWLATASVLVVMITLGVSQVMLIHANRELERQRDRANIAASASENVTAFLLDIFKASNPANADAGKVTARELLERGHARIEKDAALDNRTRVRLLVALGDAYGSLGLHEEAIVLYRQALATLEPDTDPSGRVQLLGKLGLALQFARHNREARDMLADAAGTEGWETLDFAVTFDLRRARAAAERSLGNLAESARLLDALLGDARAHFGPDAQLTLDVGARLVAVYSTMAEYERALALTDVLLPLARRAMGENHPITSYLLGNLGGIYMDLDRWDDAERINRQIYERFLEQFGPEGSPTQIAAATLAVSIPDRHEGLRMLRELEARQVEQYGPDAPQLVITVLDVAWVLSRVPAREADAWREYERALDLATRHYGEHHPILGTIHYGFAALHARNGNDAGALKHFRVASAKPSLQYRAARDPDFAALRGVPEFVTLLGRFGDAEPVLP